MLAIRRRKQSAIDAEAFGPITFVPPRAAAVAEVGRPLMLDNSFRALQDAGGALYERFFERLHSAYPEAHKTLPPGAPPDTRELLDTIALVLSHRHDPSRVRPQLHALGRQHAAQGLRPPHYRLICELLVRSIADLSGSQWNAELECEWTSSLNLGAAAMIEGASAGTTLQV